MNWLVDDEDVRSLVPALSELLQNELASGNRIAQTWRGWPKRNSGVVMLARPFAAQTLQSMKGDVSHFALNDPHYWADELTHEPSGHMLVTRL